MVRKIIIVISMTVASRASGQIISNPSFENATGQGRVPNGWLPCEFYSTPDTQPGAFGCITKASHGNSYASLVGRTTPAPSAGYTEDFATTLLRPLKKGSCYTLKMDLAHSEEFFVQDFDKYFFSSPMKLAIIGSSLQCSGGQTLAITPAVAHSNWQTYTFKLSPTEDVKFLRLYSLFAETESFCNILIDNLQLTEVIEESTTSEDIFVVKYGIITLDAGEATTYQWSLADGLSCATCRQPSLKVTTSRDYTVYTQRGAGCGFYEKVFKIKLLTKEDLFIPNVITPNGDGFNDTFVIRNLPQNSELTITNRLGEVLFKTDNYDNSWGGIYNGELLMPDTYWYMLRFDKSQNPLTGNIYVKQTQ